MSNLTHSINHIHPYFQRCVAWFFSCPCWLASYRLTSVLMSRTHSTSAQGSKLPLCDTKYKIHIQNINRTYKIVVKPSIVNMLTLCNIKYKMKMQIQNINRKYNIVVEPSIMQYTALISTNSLVSILSPKFSLIVRIKILMIFTTFIQRLP